MKRKGSLVLPFLLLCLFSTIVKCQVNITGKPGLIYVPSADSARDGTFRMGYNFNPAKYAFGRRDIIHSEGIVYANLAILPRLEINMNFLRVIRRTSDGKRIRQGLGDRMLDIRYLILKETKNRPSLAIVITSPFGIGGPLLTHVLTSTKNFKLSEEWQLGATVGVGSPYFVYRDAGNLTSSNIFGDFKWQKKSGYKQNANYLVGPFGGAVLQYRKKLGLMAEYDGNHINVGAYGVLFKRWTLQAGLLNGDGFTAGTSYAFALMKPSKPLRNKK